MSEDKINLEYETTMSSIEADFNMEEEEYLKTFNLTEDCIKEELKKN